MVDLSPQRFISVEDLIERVIRALRAGEPFGLTRWADSSNWIMGGDGTAEEPYRYREGYLEVEHWGYFHEAFLRGAEASDVIGVHANDAESARRMEAIGLDLSGKALVNPWCNRLVNSRREWADEVLGGDWSVALVGNHMPAYALWLRDRFPRLRIMVVHTASHWLEVRAAMSLMEQTKPQLALLGAGWYTSCLVGAAKLAGAVALSYGFAARDHLCGQFLPNSEGERGPAGQAAWAAQHHPGGWDVEPQTREIRIES